MVMGKVSLLITDDIVKNTDAGLYCGLEQKIIGYGEAFVVRIYRATRNPLPVYLFLFARLPQEFSRRCHAEDIIYITHMRDSLSRAGKRPCTIIKKRLKKQ